MDDSFFQGISMRWIVSIPCSSRAISKLPFENVLRASLQLFFCAVVVVYYRVLFILYYVRNSRFNSEENLPLIMRIFDTFCNVKIRRGIPYILLNAHDVGCWKVISICFRKCSIFFSVMMMMMLQHWTGVLRSFLLFFLFIITK